MHEGKIRYLNLFSALSECTVEGNRLEFTKITPYINVQAAQQEVSVHITTNHGRMMAKKKINIGEGEQATLAVVEKMRMPEIIKIGEPLLFKRADRAYVRFVNLTKTEVSVLRVNGDVVCILPPQTAGEYTLAQEGGYVFELCGAGVKKVITCRLEKENKYSLYIADSAPRSKLDFFVYKDD